MAKRINLIVKGQKCLTELLGIKEKKIRRAVESALDFTEESAVECKEKRQLLLNELGENADNKEALVEIINRYCDLIDQEDEWNRKHKQVLALKKELEEEVKEEE